MFNNANKMNSLFKKIIPEEEQERFFNELESSTWFLKRLSKVIEYKVDQSQIDSENKSIYKLFRWKDYIADSIGYRRMGREVVSLLTRFDSEDQKDSSQVSFIGRNKKIVGNDIKSKTIQSMFKTR